MYTVIGNPRTRTMRVLWMLEELGLSYDLDPSGPHTDSVKAQSNLGKIPVLVTDDGPIFDSVAIVTYLADRHAAFTHPSGTIERARQDAMTQFCVDEIEGALWTAAKNSFVNPEEHRCADIKPVAQFEFGRAMDRLALLLGDAEYVAGDGFTVPDLLLGHCAGWAANAKFDIPAGPVADYLGRMRARPALARAMKRGAEATQAA